ncbi:MAG: Gfo/Idh/MocA family oxidoreductase [Candidatus Omnitrophica bacterium]|nr:Gfo/Idh/MocA family oxidoreductase [Candidatus Omnitrophota bacterium]MCM8771067.1 Gfo/Idh/MocA family oxidoreductase [Candidatus Omnitrophota bacterium]
MLNKIKVAVIGVGHLGSIHARIYKNLKACELVAVCDTDPQRLKDISRAFRVAAYSDYRALFDKVEAVSIAVPTQLHYAIVRDFLEHDIHTLVEKPFTTELKEADGLIDIAKSKDLILQVGHVERFNSAFTATLKIIKEPKFIECHRLSPFSRRSLDVGVVLDLMIHDIDIILGLISYKIKKIESVGINVLTPFEDIANARITFENGCVANLTASRVSDDVIRKIRIFQENTYISLDYKEAKARVYRKDGGRILQENLPIEKEEPLKKELESFIDCVINRKTPLVSGTVARDALAVALEIQNQIWQKNKS